ncbi:MAG: hypothetical protein ABII22_05005 [Candidatus Micrarchaeota archaeon]
MTCGIISATLLAVSFLELHLGIVFGIGSAVALVSGALINYGLKGEHREAIKKETDELTREMKELAGQTDI